MGDLDEIVERARKGDRDAFSELVARTYTDTYTLAYRLTGSDADACDVVQDTYVRAFRSIRKFRGDARFTTWLFRITANCASTHMTKRNRHRHEMLGDDVVVLDTVSAHDPQHNMDNVVLHTRLVEALEMLPKSMREVIVLRDVYDLTHDDIAQELGISVTAAKVRLHRARKKLRNIVEATEEELNAASGLAGVQVLPGNPEVASRVEEMATESSAEPSADVAEGGDSHAV